MFDEVLSVNTLPEQLNSRIRTKRVRAREENGEIILTPIVEPETKDNKDNPKRKMNFVEGPPLPDSFFDPLPEEELQAWDL